jgi:hypothetical protein
VSRRLDWEKARWDSFKAHSTFELCNDATKSANAEMDLVIRTRKAKAKVRAKSPEKPVQRAPAILKPTQSVKAGVKSVRPERRDRPRFTRNMCVIHRFFGIGYILDFDETGPLVRFKTGKIERLSPTSSLDLRPYP